jgi:hypothetical protein
MKNDITYFCKYYISGVAIPIIFDCKRPQDLKLYTTLFKRVLERQYKLRKTKIRVTSISEQEKSLLAAM